MGQGMAERMVAIVSWPSYPEAFYYEGREYVIVDDSTVKVKMDGTLQDADKDTIIKALLSHLYDVHYDAWEAAMGDEL